MTPGIAHPLHSLQPRLLPARVAPGEPRAQQWALGIWGSSISANQRGFLGCSSHERPPGCGLQSSVGSTTLAD